MSMARNPTLCLSAVSGSFPFQTKYITLPLDVTIKLGAETDSDSMAQRRVGSPTNGWFSPEKLSGDSSVLPLPLSYIHSEVWWDGLNVSILLFMVSLTLMPLVSCRCIFVTSTHLLVPTWTAIKSWVPGPSGLETLLYVFAQWCPPEMTWLIFFRNPESRLQDCSQQQYPKIHFRWSPQTYHRKGLSCRYMKLPVTISPLSMDFLSICHTYIIVCIPLYSIWSVSYRVFLIFDLLITWGLRIQVRLTRGSIIEIQSHG